MVNTTADKTDTTVSEKEPPVSNEAVLATKELSNGIHSEPVIESTVSSTETKAINLHQELLEAGLKPKVPEEEFANFETQFETEKIEPVIASKLELPTEEPLIEKEVSNANKSLEIEPAVNFEDRFKPCLDPDTYEKVSPVATEKAEETVDKTNVELDDILHESSPELVIDSLIEPESKNQEFEEHEPVAKTEHQSSDEQHDLPSVTDTVESHEPDIKESPTPKEKSEEPDDDSSAKADFEDPEFGSDSELVVDSLIESEATEGKSQGQESQTRDHQPTNKGDDSASETEVNESESSPLELSAQSEKDYIEPKTVTHNDNNEDNDRSTSSPEAIDSLEQSDKDLKVEIKENDLEVSTVEQQEQASSTDTKDEWHDRDSEEKIVDFTTKTKDSDSEEAPGENGADAAYVAYEEDLTSTENSNSDPGKAANDEDYSSEQSGKKKKKNKKKKGKRGSTTNQQEDEMATQF